MKDIPYSVLRQDAHAYDIMLLRDQYGNTFPAIARDYKILVARMTQIYNHGIAYDTSKSKAHI